MHVKLNLVETLRLTQAAIPVKFPLFENEGHKVYILRLVTSII